MTYPPTPPLNFIKMHGLGNDFVIFDARKSPVALTPPQIKRIADRKYGVGCDQVIVLAPPEGPTGDVAMATFNPDGLEVSTCGNGTRCVAWLLAQESKKDISIETQGGLLRAYVGPKDVVTVEMGPARLNWEDIPLSQALDTKRLPIKEGPLEGPCAVGVGNPHMIFVVKKIEEIDIKILGPKLEHHPLFPERANVSLVEVETPTTLKLKVWERGAGLTLACGTAACAVTVACHTLGLSQRKVSVLQAGGELEIEWLANNHILMSGPIAFSFKGQLIPALCQDFKEDF